MDRLLRPKECAKRLGVHRATLYRMEARGEFPKRVVLRRDSFGNPRISGWWESDVKAWVDAQTRKEVG